MGFSLGKALGAVSTGGLSLVAGGGLKDALLGKQQDPFAPTRLQELDPSLKKSVEMGREAQQKGLSEILKDTSSPELIAQAEQERALRAQEGAGADAARKAQEAIAQRGLGRSSIGLGMEKSIGERTARAKANIMAGLAERLRNLKQERQNRLLQAGGSVLSTPGAQRSLIVGQNKGRSGGLFGAIAPIAGAAIGGHLGGAQGAAAGMQAGSGLSSALSNM